MGNSSDKSYTFKFAINSDLIDYIVKYWEKQDQLKGLKYERKFHFSSTIEYKFKNLNEDKRTELFNLRLFVDNEINRATELISNVKEHKTLKGLLLHFFPDYRRITNFNIYLKENLCYYLILINSKFQEIIKQFIKNVCYYSGDEEQVLNNIYDEFYIYHKLPEEKKLKTIVSFLLRADDEQ